MSIEIKLQNFLKKKKLNIENLEFSSLDLVAFVVDVEKHFDIEFELDEINDENFKNQSALLKVIVHKLKKTANNEN